MITKFHVKNFKCLADVNLELGPFTVLIGPNDSGKTSFLEAIGWLTKTTENSSPFQTRDSSQLENLIWKKRKNQRILLEVAGQENSTFEYALELPIGGDSKESWRINETIFEAPPVGSLVTYPNLNLQIPRQPHQSLLSMFTRQELATKDRANPLTVIAQALNSSKEYHLNPLAMRDPGKPETNPILDTNGKNLASVLHSILIGPDRQSVIELEKKLQDAIPTIKGISTPLSPDHSQNHVIDFTLNLDVKPLLTIPSAQASDGAMLLTAFLTLAYGNTPRILLIEEPENGLHPSRLGMVIEILHKMSTGEIGNQKRQVILTTHSPLLLNFVQPEEVRIFRRNEEGATEVTPMNKVPNIDKLQTEFAPGEMWFLFGEEELLKGQPA